MKDPFWSQFEYWIYYRVIIREERLSKVFDELILRNYQNLSEERRFDGYDYEEK